MNQIFLPYISFNPRDSVTEQIHTLLIENPEQCRPIININSSLIDAANYRASHMADNNYFNHNDPFTKETPNEVVARFGFDLHENYPTIGNTGESIGGGTPHLSHALDGLLNSPPHRKHLLGLSKMFCQQLEIGVGFAYNEDSDYNYYLVILIYRQEE